MSPSRKEAGSAYMRGDWHADDLTALMRLLLRNRSVLDGLDAGALLAADGLMAVQAITIADQLSTPPAVQWISSSATSFPAARYLQLLR